MPNIETLRKAVASGRARKDIAKQSLSQKRKSLASYEDTLESQRKALALLQDVASKTQTQLKEAVERVVQNCIDLLFPGYEFRVNFIPKRGKVDAEFRI